MRRTTIALEDSLFHALKTNAVKHKQSLKDYLNTLLQWAVRQQKQQKEFSLKWETVKGKKAPDIDISDRDRLYDFLNGAHRP